MNFPNFDFENRLWEKGYKLIGGVDEVGRGCLAGPVVAGCVIFGPNTQTTVGKVRIDDSKKITERQRKLANIWILRNSLGWGIGKASVALINKIGISKATQVAMRSAVNKVNKKLKLIKIEYLLLDAFYLPFMRGLPKGKRIKIRGERYKKDGYDLISKSRSKQLAIINGDEKSVSIAAASIIAKVYRDTLMENIGSQELYKKYDWINNKGYGSQKHREAILQYGKTKHHRELYINSFINNKKFDN